MFGSRKDLKPKKIWVVTEFDEEGEEMLFRAFRYKCEAEHYARYCARSVSSTITEVILY